MGSVAVILLIGKLYGTFEIKWLLNASVVLFEAGSALCGAAPSTNALIVGRVIAGIGGAGMYIGYEIQTPTTVEHSKMQILLYLLTGLQRAHIYLHLYHTPRTAHLQCVDWVLLGHGSNPRSCRCWRLFREQCDLALGFLHQPTTGCR